MDVIIPNPVTKEKIGSVVNAAASATPNDTDLVMSVESSVAKKNTWTQIKAFLKTYFDSVYQSQINAKSKIELMFGTTTTFSPLDSTTTYVNLQTNLAVNASASTRVFQGFTGTIVACWLLADPQNTLGSTENVQYNLRNVTDATSTALGTVTYDVRGRSTYTTGLSITLDSSKFYSIEIVFPAFATNPTNMAILGKLIII